MGRYWVREMWWLEWPKVPILEHPSRVNVFTCHIQYWNLHGSTFNLIPHSEKKNWLRKHLCQSDLKSQYYFLTTWLPITCIVAIIERVSCNMFKRHHLKNGKHFLQFLFNFWNLDKIFGIFKKKIRFIP